MTAATLHENVIGPFSWDGTEFTTDHGELHSIDGTSTDGFVAADIESVLYQGTTGDEWDGDCAAVVRLKDGRLAAWETWWGPTGHGFGEDAYGGDSEVWFAKPENLSKLVLQALTDKGRRLVGIPAEGLAP